MVYGRMVGVIAVALHRLHIVVYPLTMSRDTNRNTMLKSLFLHSRNCHYYRLFLGGI